MTVLIISTIVMELVIVMVMMTLKMMTMLMMMMNIMILKTASLRSRGSAWQITGSSQMASSPSPQTTGQAWINTSLQISTVGCGFRLKSHKLT